MITNFNKILLKNTMNVGVIESFVESFRTRVIELSDENVSRYCQRKAFVNPDRCRNCHLLNYIGSIGHTSDCLDFNQFERKDDVMMTWKWSKTKPSLGMFTSKSWAFKAAGYNPGYIISKSFSFNWRAVSYLSYDSLCNMH